MSICWPIVALVFIVAVIVSAERKASFKRLFGWLPVPLWCYVLPMLGVEVGLLPREQAAYQMLTQRLLPFALAILLLGVDLPSVLRTGYRALAATILGALSIVLGAPLIGWLLRYQLPQQSWTGIGTLAATWTGGSMNLLAVSNVLKTPEHIFTSLVIVDAIIAYSWMALLVSLSSMQSQLDCWLHAVSLDIKPIRSKEPKYPISTRKAIFMGVLFAICLTIAAQSISRLLPLNRLVSSYSGWTVLLITTFALCASLISGIRKVGQGATSFGYLFLYLALSAMGAQASFKGVLSAPAWIVLGFGVALVHGICMLLAGRLLRLPFSALATASQANFGGVVSAPLVGAVYKKELAPVGLLLAIGCNAIGTYLGMISAFIAHRIM